MTIYSNLQILNYKLSSWTSIYSNERLSYLDIGIISIWG